MRDDNDQIDRQISIDSDEKIGLTEMHFRKTDNNK